MANIILPPLLPEYEPTRATLHAYAKTLGAIARTHGIRHPKWWHVSLEVRPEGLVTDPVPLPDGGSLGITMDLKRHEIVLRASSGEDLSIDLEARPTGTEVGEMLIEAAGRHGLDDRYDRERFADDDIRVYEPAAAGAYLDAFVAVAGQFQRRKVSLGDRVSPVQLWPHGFDLSFEWFGTKIVGSGEEQAPAQLNLGLYPGGDRPYFYSNPWPFDTDLTSAALPDGASWHTEGWSGGYLPYDVVQQSGDPVATLAGFAEAVFTAARPTLEGP
jgi:hypothetical protein